MFFRTINILLIIFQNFKYLKLKNLLIIYSFLFETALLNGIIFYNMMQENLLYLNLQLKYFTALIIKTCIN